MSFEGGFQLPDLEGPLRRNVSAVVRMAADDIAANAVHLIDTSPATGRVYRKGQPDEHQASAPGEPPATDQGHLSGGIRVEQPNDLTAEVIVTAEYGPVLEFGGTHVEARPFLQPSIDKVAPVFEAALRKVLEDA